jgi:isoleucyl-tRNA synthetase
MRSFLDVLTNWYIRRSRDRFWDSDNAMSGSTQQAFDTLYTALEVLTRTVAPLLPLTTEEIWRGLTGGRSVHLQDWPDADDAARRPRPGRIGMDRAREVCSAARRLRKGAVCGRGCRWPGSPWSPTDPTALSEFTAIIADEVNVREVVLGDLASATRRTSVSRNG